jgi:hypothetical protein
MKRGSCRKQCRLSVPGVRRLLNATAERDNEEDFDIEQKENDRNGVKLDRDNGRARPPTGSLPHSYGINLIAVRLSGSDQLRDKELA